MTAATDNADAATVLKAIIECAYAWEGTARIIGNVRAQDILRACREALAALTAEQAAVPPDREALAKRLLMRGDAICAALVSASWHRTQVQEVGDLIAEVTAALRSPLSRERRGYVFAEAEPLVAAAIRSAVNERLEMAAKEIYKPHVIRGQDHLGYFANLVRSLKLEEPQP